MDYWMLQTQRHRKNRTNNYSRFMLTLLLHLWYLHLHPSYLTFALIQPFRPYHNDPQQHATCIRTMKQLLEAQFETVPFVQIRSELGSTSGRTLVPVMSCPKTARARICDPHEKNVCMIRQTINTSFAWRLLRQMVASVSLDQCCMQQWWVTSVLYHYE